MAFKSFLGILEIVSPDKHLNQGNNMNIEEFIKFMSECRLSNKNAWFWWEGFVMVNGICKSVLVKGCGLNFQRFEVNGYRCLGNYPRSVGQWKKEIKEVLESAI